MRYKDRIKATKRDSVLLEAGRAASDAGWEESAPARQVVVSYCAAALCESEKGDGATVIEVDGNEQHALL
jgi:hypothetical protein